MKDITKIKKKILEAFEGKSIKKYKLIVEFFTDKPFKDASEILKDTILYNDLFDGVITKEELKEIKRIK